jgi:hypothetical protein
VVVLALSPAAVASEHVAREIAIAQERPVPVVPAIVVPVQDLGALRYHVADLQRIDLSQDVDVGMAKLLDALRSVAARADRPPDWPDHELMARNRAILDDPQLPISEKVRRFQEAYAGDAEKARRVWTKRRDERLGRIASIDHELDTHRKRQLELQEESVRLLAAGHQDGSLMVGLVARELDEIRAASGALERERRQLRQERQRQLDEDRRSLEEFSRRQRAIAQDVKKAADDLLDRVFKS